MKIVFNPPSKDEEGYLKRTHKALLLKRQFKDPQPETVEEMVEFLLPYITEPENREQARQALWKLSENQFNELMDVVGGRSTDDPLSVAKNAMP